MKIMEIKVLFEKFPFLETWKDELRNTKNDEIEIGDIHSYFDKTPCEDSYSWSGGTRSEGMAIYIIFLHKKGKYQINQVEADSHSASGRAHEPEINEEGETVIGALYKNWKLLDRLIAIVVHEWAYCNFENPGYDTSKFIVCPAGETEEEKLSLLADILSLFCRKEREARKKLEKKVTARNRQIRDLRKSLTAEK